ncbi:MAG: hypothetical protein GF400_07205 [Candidatus Eisenbacteria bacterium]|nr:hypothetical protein [Candidatus Eisenbacteria bacterium]
MRRRSTRIVATISPMTVRRILGIEPDQPLGPPQTADALNALSEAGVDVFRLNLSFRDDRFIEQVLAWFRDEEGGRAAGAALLGDLQGPKLRLGDFKASRETSGPASTEASRREDQARLERGQEFLLYFRPDPGAGVSLSTAGNERMGTVLLNDEFYESFGECVRRGLKDGPVEISVGDGNTLLVVDERADVRTTHVASRVEIGGMVGSRKGVMPRRISIDVPSIITDKDREDLRFLLRRGGRHVSFVALSFVKRPSDVLRLRGEIDNYSTYRSMVGRRVRELGAGGKRARSLRTTLLPAIVAKIETREAVEPDAFESILDLSDAVMVARGDLALQMDPDRVPWEQKRIIRTCRMRGKPVITATQMLHSMQHNPRPTRSEVNDVFNAALDGTDATMLSGETANGRYPVESVQTMAAVLRRAEEFWHSGRSDLVAEWADVRRSLKKIVDGASVRLAERQSEVKKGLGASSKRLASLADRLYEGKREKTRRQTTTDMVCMSAWAMISSPEVVAIVAVTASGRTARMMARFRPDVPVFAVTHDDENRRKLLLSFGILPVEVDVASAAEEEIYDVALKALAERGWLEKAEAPAETRELVVFVSGSPIGDPGTTNQLRLVSLSDAGYRLREIAQPETFGRV